MHMADALISPAVGATTWALATGLSAYSIKSIKQKEDDSKIPLMGVMGAFVFAAQMINFTIPGTGSSGHIGGGLLLAALLGPFEGFLTLVSILAIQSLFFADGGILALGCNILNLGFFTCFIAYPLIYKKILKKEYSKRKIYFASIFASIAGLQLGALSVVLQTLLSGKTELPFMTFVALMQPIHLAIGITEGIVTAAVINFIWKARPSLLNENLSFENKNNTSYRKLIIIIMTITFLVAGGLSLFASSNPDGLEWAISKASGKEELNTPKGVHVTFSELQENTAVMPDYALKSTGKSEDKIQLITSGSTLAGLTGSMLTLFIVMIMGGAIKKNRKKKNSIPAN